MFIVARVCTLNVKVGTGQNVLNVPDGVQSFLNTGLVAALITTILGSNDGSASSCVATWN